MGKNPQSFLWGWCWLGLDVAKSFNSDENVREGFSIAMTMWYSMTMTMWRIDSMMLEMAPHLIFLFIFLPSWWPLSAPFLFHVNPTAKLAGLPSWWHFYMQWWQWWGQIGLRPLDDGEAYLSQYQHSHILTNTQTISHWNTLILREQLISIDENQACMITWYMGYKRWCSSSLVSERSKLHAYLIFVFFSPQTQFLVKFFSTQKRVNRDKTDFATKQRKSHKREILQ